MRRGSYESTYNMRAMPYRQIFVWLLSIVGIYLLSRFLTGFVLRFDPYYIYVAAIAIVMAIIISQKLEFAILIYAFLAPLIIGASPGFEGTRTGYRPAVLPSQVGLVILCGIWAITSLVKRRRLFVRCSLYMPFATFLFVCVLSIISTFIIWDFDIPVANRRWLNQVSEVSIYVFCGMAFWLASSAIQRIEWVRALYWPVLAVGLYNSILIFSRIEPPVSMIHGDFMTAYAAALTLARLFFGSDRKGVRKLLWVTFLVLSVSLVFNYSWVSGWLSACIAIAVVTYFKSKKAVVAMAFVGFIVMFVYPGLYSIVYEDSRAQGDMDRIDLWYDSIEMANSVNPVLGIGPGDYIVYSRKYGTKWYGENTYTNAHSNYAQMIAETGYLGFIVFLWLMYAGMRMGIRCVQKVDPNTRWFAIGAAAVFIGIALTSVVGDYILPSRTNGGLNSFGTSVFAWLLLGASVAAVSINSKKKEPQDDEPVLEEMHR